MLTATAGFRHDAIATAREVLASLARSSAAFTVGATEDLASIGSLADVDVVMDAIGPSSFRKSYRSLRQGGRLIMYGASELSTGETRDLKAVAQGLLKMPLATMPWWQSLGVMNENKGVFGLNMLKWWDAEGSLERMI